MSRGPRIPRIPRIPISSSFIRPSGTGNSRSAAKRAPLESRDSELIGDERTSDAQIISITGRRPHHAQAQETGGEQKRTKQ
jgi:hypothetical protein